MEKAPSGIFASERASATHPASVAEVTCRIVSYIEVDEDRKTRILLDLGIEQGYHGMDTRAGISRDGYSKDQRCSTWFCPCYFHVAGTYGLVTNVQG